MYDGLPGGSTPSLFHTCPLSSTVDENGTVAEGLRGREPALLATPFPRQHRANTGDGAGLRGLMPHWRYAPGEGFEHGRTGGR